MNTRQRLMALAAGLSITAGLAAGAIAQSPATGHEHAHPAGSMHRVHMGADRFGPMGRELLQGIDLTEAQRDGRTLYVDMSGVTFIDSRGLGALLAANERAREGAAQLRIHAPSDSVRRLLTISGVTAVIVEADELPAA